MRLPEHYIYPRVLGGLEDLLLGRQDMIMPGPGGRFIPVPLGPYHMALDVYETRIFGEKLMNPQDKFPSPAEVRDLKKQRAVNSARDQINQSLIQQNTAYVRSEDLKYLGLTEEDIQPIMAELKEAGWDVDPSSFKITAPKVKK